MCYDNDLHVHVHVSLSSEIRKREWFMLFTENQSSIITWAVFKLYMHAKVQLYEVCTYHCIGHILLYVQWPCSSSTWTLIRPNFETGVTEFASRFMRGSVICWADPKVLCTLLTLLWAFPWLPCLCTQPHSSDQYRTFWTYWRVHLLCITLSRLVHKATQGFVLC